MSEFFPGSGSIRITTAEDVERAVAARIPPPRPHMRALTASAMKLDERSSALAKRLSQPWQLLALSHFDLIGEIHFACHFNARQMSRVRFFPARLEENGDLTPIDSGPPTEILDRIKDQGGGRSRLQFNWARLDFITGEGILFGDRLETENERWRYIWKDEVKRLENGSWERLTFDKKSYDPPQIGIAYGMGNPHPRHSDEADSPLRSIVDIAEELLILTASVRSTAVSRMTSGMVILPTELSPNSYGPPADDDYQGDEDPETNVFLEDYIEHASSQKENPGTAEAAIPFLLEGAYEYIDRVRYMATHDPQTDYMEKELRKECIQRLSLALDMSPEDLLGMTDANHWTAKQVQHDRWRIFGVNKAQQFASDLNEAYLQPALINDEYPDWMHTVIAFDDSQVVISPDRTEDADKALDRIAISFEGYRELKGIPESMAPSEDEKEFLASLKLRQPIELEDGNLIIPQRGPVANADSNGSPEDGPPAPTGGRSGSRQESQTASGRIHGAAELALMRCRELAGVRIRHKCEECAKDQPLSVVASVVGPEFAEEPLKLVHGGTEGFETWLVEQGFDHSQAESLCQQLKVYAARTLFEPRCPQLPAGFIAAVEKAKEVSDSLVSG